MKYFGLLPLAACPVLLAAQTSDSTSYPPRQACQHRFRLVAPYEPEQDKTVRQLGPLPLDSNLAFMVLTALDGHGNAAPAKSVVMTFWSTGPKGECKVNSHVRLRVDAESVNLGDAWNEPKPRPGFSEILLKGIPISSLLRLVHSGKAVITLGSRTCSLSPEELAALRDLASRLTPSG
jgi:hypothetical protein